MCVPLTHLNINSQHKTFSQSIYMNSVKNYSLPKLTVCAKFTQSRTCQAMYVHSNIEARKRIHRCCEKKSVMYSECVSLALVIQHAIRMRRII